MQDFLLEQGGRFRDGESFMETMSVHEVSQGCMDGWMSGRLGGWMGGREGRWVDGWMDGQLDDRNLDFILLRLNQIKWLFCC